MAVRADEFAFRDLVENCLDNPEEPGRRIPAVGVPIDRRRYPILYSA